MDIRLRLLTAEIAILTAIAGLFNTNTAEWTKVYERRLFCEMQMNLWRGGYEQKTVEEVPTGSDPVPARTPGVEETPLVLVGEVVNEPQTSQEAVIPGMASFCEAMVEAEDPRPTLAAETESYSQRLAQKTEGEAVNEQEAEEKGLEESDIVPEALERIQPAAVPEPVGAVQKAAPVAPDPESYVCSVSCNGDALDAGVSEYLKRRLTEAGIGWFFPYACCIAYQESSFNPLAENLNGRDKGLFQFRAEFHPELDWRNPYQQVDIFTAQMAARANAGCDVYTMISRHMMSDYGAYNQQYVDHVLQHLPKLQGVWN